MSYLHIALVATFATLTLSVPVSTSANNDTMPVDRTTSDYPTVLEPISASAINLSIDHMEVIRCDLKVNQSIVVNGNFLDDLNMIEVCIVRGREAWSNETDHPCHYIEGLGERCHQSHHCPIPFSYYRMDGLVKLLNRMKHFHSQAFLDTIACYAMVGNKTQCSLKVLRETGIFGLTAYSKCQMTRYWKMAEANAMSDAKHCFMMHDGRNVVKDLCKTYTPEGMKQEEANTDRFKFKQALVKAIDAKFNAHLDDLTARQSFSQRQAEYCLYSSAWKANASDICYQIVASTNKTTNETNPDLEIIRALYKHQKLVDLVTDCYIHEDIMSTRYQRPLYCDGISWNSTESKAAEQKWKEEKKPSRSYYYSFKSDSNKERPVVKFEFVPKHQHPAVRDIWTIVERDMKKWSEQHSKLHKEEGNFLFGRRVFFRQRRYGWIED